MARNSLFGQAFSTAYSNSCIHTHSTYTAADACSFIFNQLSGLPECFWQCNGKYSTRQCYITAGNTIMHILGQRHTVGCLRFSTIALAVMLLVSKETISLPCKLTPVTWRRVPLFFIFFLVYLHAIRVAPSPLPAPISEHITALSSVCLLDLLGVQQQWWWDERVKFRMRDCWCSLRPSVNSYCLFHSDWAAHRTHDNIGLVGCRLSGGETCRYQSFLISVMNSQTKMHTRKFYKITIYSWVFNK